MRTANVFKIHKSFNFLKTQSDVAAAIPIAFRVAVCNACNWSEATFYRKSKGKNQISDAEKDTIAQIAYRLYEQAGAIALEHERMEY